MMQLPKRVVSNRVSVEREAAPYRGLTPEERWRATASACRAAARQLAQRGQYGIPRATNDVDINVFVEPSELAPVFAALRPLGLSFDDNEARAAAEEAGLFIVRLDGYRIDVFTPSIAFAWEAARTRVRHTIDGEDIWFLSAEALCVFKLLFFRGKDLVDLERLIAVQGAAVDAAYVRAQIVAMLGVSDERVQAWDRLYAENGPA